MLRKYSKTITFSSRKKKYLIDYTKTCSQGPHKLVKNAVSTRNIVTDIVQRRIINNTWKGTSDFLAYFYLL
jgi:hypothetical protein